jgi:hypothetical protein
MIQIGALLDLIDREILRAVQDNMLGPCERRYGLLSGGVNGLTKPVFFFAGKLPAVPNFVCCHMRVLVCYSSVSDTRVIVNILPTG